MISIDLIKTYHYYGHAYAIVEKFIKILIQNAQCQRHIITHGQRDPYHKEKNYYLNMILCIQGLPDLEHMIL